ncbi:cation diffusion facilitator family transporter [Propionicicella superfundia]|uniref:cation diffusion facilitator family transporter n=1 Tax=Propionicicella superfundia TaxID=348582 RepID=UPI0003FB0578|nr:cation diffusion facilitator family transporter [Propionicicella superfundia]
MSASGGTKAVVAAMTANAAIAVMKFTAWLLTGASSMLAEGIHSVADTSNQLLLLRGGRSARKAATEEHPFGFGRERYVAAFLVAIILFSLGGLFALYEAFHKYEEVVSGHPNELLEGPWWWVPLVVLVGAMVAEGLSLRTAIHESSGAKGKQTWFRFIRTSRQPELPVVLLEDTAALLGLVFALLGVGLTLLTHNGLWDVAGTALIGVLLITVAGVLAVETKSLLVGESATPEAVRRIEAALTASDGVQRVIHMKTLHLGPDEVMVAAKIAVEPTASADRVAEVINTAEAAIRAVDPMVTALYIEPDIWHGADAAPTGEES